jgi:hypothetical protein
MVQSYWVNSPRTATRTAQACRPGRVTIPQRTSSSSSGRMAPQDQGPTRERRVSTSPS